MISLFANTPSKAAPEAVQAQPVSSAVRKASAPLTATAPRRGFKWFTFGNAKKRLQMLESVSLGEKRFVALVKVDGRQFLIGGAPSNVGMLAELAPEESFHQVLKDATQGLDISLPASALKTAEKAPVALPEPTVAQASAASLEPFRTLVPRPVAAITAAPVVELSAMTNATAPAKTSPVDLPSPAAPVDPIEPVDPAFEEPLSFSPSLVAAMEARRTATKIPAPNLVLREAAPLVAPLFKVETAVEKPQEKRIPELEGTPAARNLRPAQAPQFTFQVSHFLNLGMKPAWTR